MANSNIASIGRFSAQMLTYLGTQRTVKNVTGSPSNTFKYETGTTVFPNPSSVYLGNIGEGVVGSYSHDSYNSTKSYFLSRGASEVYADTMTALTIDIASTMGISPQLLLEQAASTQLGKISFLPEAFRVFNEFRDPSHQVGTVSAIVNKSSLQAREIRS